MSGTASAKATPISKSYESPSLQSLRRPPPARRRGSGTHGSILQEETITRSITPQRPTQLSSPRFSSTSTTPSRFKLPPPRSAIRSYNEEQQEYQSLDEVEHESFRNHRESSPGETSHLNQSEGTTEIELYPLHQTPVAIHPTGVSLPEESVVPKPSNPESRISLTAVSSSTRSVSDGEENVHRDFDTTEVKSCTLPTVPRGWIELTDPASGQLYYYNEMDNTTSWERPPEKEGFDNTSIHDMEEPLNDLSDNPEKSPDGAAGAADNYSNLGGGRTEQEGSEKSLPHGWVELVDPASGLSYYFNEVESITSWDRPIESREHFADEAKADETEFDLPDQGNKQPFESEASPGECNLPDGWIELTDPTSGLPYYFNEMQDTTSWERPSSYKEHAEPTTQTMIRDQDEFIFQPESDAGKEVDGGAIDFEISDRARQEEHISAEPEGKADKGAILPLGWVSMVDPTSGDPYYYNEVLNTVSWEIPVQEKSSSSDIPSNTIVGHVRGSADGVDKNTNAEEHAGLADNESTGVANKLPDGWIELMDRASGLPYYYNESENSTSWERPCAETIAETTRAGNEEESSPPATSLDFDNLETKVVENEVVLDDDDGENHPESKNSSGKDTELLHGWVEMVDPDAGDHYCFKEVENLKSDRPALEIESSRSGATVEESPTIASVSSEADLVQVPSESSHELRSLPPGWIELTDPASGRPYYLNEKENISTWDHPCEAFEAGTIAEPESTSDVTKKNSDLSNEKMEDDVLNEENDDVVPEHLLEEEGKVDELEGSVLHSGWVELVDPDSGSRYYFNETENLTSWEPPPELISEVQHEIEKVGGAILPIENGNEMDKISAEDGDVFPSDHADGEASIESREVMNENIAVFESGKESEEHVPVVEAGANLIEIQSDSLVEVGPRSSVPPGWLELIDPDSGNPYYYNVTDKITSWEHPALESTSNEEHTVDEIRPAEETEPDSRTSDILSKSDSLPRGWVELVDPASKRPYYYNEIDDVASWDHPCMTSGREIEVTPEFPEPQTGPSGHLEEVNRNLSESNAEADHFESEHVDENKVQTSGWVQVDEPAPYIPGERVEDMTSWEMPENYHETPKDTMKSPPDPDKRSTIDSTNEKRQHDNLSEDFVLDDAQSELPLGWTELLDPASGMKYYFNETDGTSSWERPVLPPHRPGKISMDSRKENKLVAGARVSELPDGWENRTDPATGTFFYYNATLNLTTWNHPDQEGSLDESAQTRQPTAFAPKVSAVFGFGGRLCIVRRTSGCPARVEVRSVNQLVSSHSVVLSQRLKKEIGFAGPLVGTEDRLVASYIRKRVEEQTDLLWQLIAVAANSKGKLRSDTGFGPESSPETLIVDLLLKTCTTEVRNRQDTEQTTKVPTSADLGSIEDLLVRGKREEAVEEAIGKGHFEVALLVASMCTPQTYQMAAKEYADRCLRRGSPLHTIALLFSKQLHPPTRRDFESSRSSLWTLGRQELLKSWKRQLCAIICNRTTGWDIIVLALGDRLLELGEPSAAHVCYMVCGCPVSSPILEDSRMTLIGCSLSSNDVTLTTTNAIEAYERTEAYEWAKRRGNSSAFIKSLQPFKLMYAMLLADLGYREAALQYLTAILECIGQRAGHNFSREETKRPLALSILSGDLESLRAALSDFEQRLSYTEETVTTSQDETLNETDTDISFVTAHTNLHEGMQWTKPVISSDINTVGSAPVKAQNDLTNMITKEQTSSYGGKAFVNTAPNLESEKRVAANRPVASDGFHVKSYLEPNREGKLTPDVSGKASNVDVAPVEQGNLKPTKSLTSLALPQEQRSEERPDSLPMEPDRPKHVSEFVEGSIGSRQVGSFHDSVNTKSIQSQVPQPGLQTPAPKSAPANLQQSSSSTTPSSEARRKGFFSFGIKDKMTKWLNPDATQADLGDKMEAYYDEKRKVWVFPGENPDEKAKPIGPPPTQIASSPVTPMVPGNNSSGANPISGAAIGDPVASMMAPPQRTPSLLRGARPGSLSTPQKPISIGFSGTPMDSSTQPPAFAIFQPTPKPSSKDQPIED